MKTVALLLAFASIVSGQGLRSPAFVASLSKRAAVVSPAFVIATNTTTAAGGGTGITFNNLVRTLNVKAGEKVLVAVNSYANGGGTLSVSNTTQNTACVQMLSMTNIAANIPDGFQVFKDFSPGTGNNTYKAFWSVLGVTNISFNEMALGVLTFSGVTSTGGTNLDYRTADREGATNTVTTTAGSIVVSIEADWESLATTLGAGETLITRANDGNNDASLNIAWKSASTTSTMTSRTGGHVNFRTLWTVELK